MTAAAAAANPAPTLNAAAGPQRSHTNPNSNDAGELGFRDEAYFGRFFRKQTGLRPTEYRIKEQSRLSLYSPNDADEP